MTDGRVSVAAQGKHFVTEQLSRTGKIARPTPRRAGRGNLTVLSPDGNRLCDVQVKARCADSVDNGWFMNSTHESAVDDRFLYCFVDFGGDLLEVPSVYVVPSKVVSEVIQSMHKAWLARRGLKEQMRSEVGLRKFLPDYTIYCGDRASLTSRVGSISIKTLGTCFQLENI